MSFPVFFDANVLYGALRTDILLTLAEHGLYRALWSAEVLGEVRKNLLEDGKPEPLVDKRLATMRQFFVDAMVTGYNALVPTVTNDPKDRHVLAAAVTGGAEVIVTFNLKDFPTESLAPFDLEAVHPDDFLLDQLDLHQPITLRALSDLIAAYDSPAMTRDDLHLALIRSGLPKFAEAVRDKLY